MSILIPGMSLPKEGENRLALFVGSDGVADVYRSVGEATPWLEHYVCECDAIELPPHGRLVDADAIIEDIRCEILEHQLNGMKGTPFYIEDLRTMWQRLEDEDIAPTIIPADPEGGAER